MKKILFVIKILMTGFVSLAQYPENLIPNMGFESPPNITTCNYTFGLFNWRQEGNVATHGTPDWITHSNAYNIGGCRYVDCPINSLGGNKYAFIGKDNYSPNGETIFNELSSPLIEGKKYKLRVWASGRPGDVFVVRILNHFTDWSSGLPDLFYCTIPTSNQNIDCKGFAFETAFTANQPNLNKIGISSINGTDGECFVFVDNVELYEYCTDLLIRQARIYKHETELEEANTIIAGSRVNNIAAGDVNMLDGSVTTYQGKQEVQLVEGFNVNRGADFTAKIVGSCGSFCTGTNIDIPTEYTICDNGCLQLNGRLMRGLTYTWSSTPVSYVEFLSAIDIPNPTFCPPANIPEGIYTFHLTVSNDCGETTTKTVNIYHSPNSNANPNFTITNSNLASKPDFPEFTINVPSQTELVVVDLMDCNGNVLRNNTYKYGVDFSEATSIDWKINDYLTPCNCYKIRVKTKNICYPNWKEETYDWDRIRTPSNIGIPNFAVCINGKRHLCFRGEGISHIQIELFNRWDRQVVNSTLNFTNNPFCFEVPKHEDKELPDGTYWMIVTITGCDGTKKVFTTSVFLPSCDQLVGDNPPGNGDTYIYDGYYPNPETGALDSLYTSISPNPLTETSIIKYHIPKAGNVKLTLLNANFEQKAILVNQNNVPVGDFEVQTSAANLANGVNYYMLELVNEKHAVIIKRFSVIK